MIANGIDFTEALQREKYIKKGKQRGTITDKTKSDETSLSYCDVKLDDIKVVGNHILVKCVENIPDSIIIVPYLDEKYNKAIITKLSEGFTTKKGVVIQYTDPRFGLRVGQKISFGSQYNKKGKIAIEGEVYFIISWKDIEFVYEDE